VTDSHLRVRLRTRAGDPYSTNPGGSHRLVSG
jgi:hypothetical protein